MLGDGFWEHIGRDLSGKGQFRLILQPTLAIILGIRLGLADARAGHAPFIWRLLTTRHARWKLFKESLSDALLPLLFSIALDSVLQYLTLHHIRPLAAVVVGGLLVWLPFVISRALTNRAWRRIHHVPLTSRR